MTSGVIRSSSLDPSQAIINKIWVTIQQQESFLTGLELTARRTILETAVSQYIGHGRSAQSHLAVALLPVLEP